LKIGLFSDSHYCKEPVPEKGRNSFLSFEKIREAMEDFKKNRADLVMCLGDMGDIGEHRENSQKDLKELVEMIRSYGIPFLYVAGNHDFKVAYIEELGNLVNLPVPPMTYDTEEYRFICLDANYESNGKHYSPDGYDWTDVNVPEEQLEYLRQALAGTEKECIIAIHEPIDKESAKRSRFGEGASTNNAAEIREILEASGKVRLVLQGHLHEYYNICKNGIRYITVTGMCEGTPNHYMLLDWNKKGYDLILKSKE